MYAKIRLYNEFKGTIHSVAVRSWGANESEVKNNVENMVKKWEEITSFSIIKISTNQIFIEKYFSKIQLYYRNGDSRSVKLNLTAETKTEAEEIANEIVSCFKNVFSFHILSTGLQG